MNKKFKKARRRMYNRLLSDSFIFDNYTDSIAECIYENRTKDGRLNKEMCKDVAQTLIHLMFDEYIKVDTE